MSSPVFGQKNPTMSSNPSFGGATANPNPPATGNPSFGTAPAKRPTGEHLPNPPSPAPQNLEQQLLQTTSYWPNQGNTTELGTVTLEKVTITRAMTTSGDQYLHSFYLPSTKTFNDGIDQARQIITQTTPDPNSPRQYNNGYHTSVAVGKVLGNTLEYNIDERPIIMPNGWQYEQRGSFTLHLTLNRSNSASVRLVICGHTDMNKLVANSRHGHSLPADTTFYCNEVFEVLPNGTHVKLHKEIAAPTLYRDGSTYNRETEPTYSTFRPEDIISSAALNEHTIDNYYGEGVKEVHMANSSHPVASPTSNNSPVEWGKEMVTKHIGAVSRYRATSGNESCTDKDIINLLQCPGDPSAMVYAGDPLNDVILLLGACGAANSDLLNFKYSALTRIDPSIDDRTVVHEHRQNNAGITDQYGKPVDSFALTGHTSTSDAGPEASVGYMIATILGSILQRANIRSVSHGIITTQTTDRQVYSEFPSVGYVSNNPIHNEAILKMFHEMIRIEIGPMLIRYGDVAITGISYWSTNMITMSVSVAGSYAVPFAMPIWADGLLSPLTSNNQRISGQDAAPVSGARTDHQTTLSNVYKLVQQVGNID